MISGEDNAAFRQRCMLACDDLSTCAGFALSTCSGAECCVFKSAADVDFFAVDASTFIRRAHASGTGASRSADGADGDAPMTKDEMEAFRDETLEAIAEATKDDDDDDGAQSIALTGAMIGAYCGLAAAMLMCGGLIGAVTISYLRPRAPAVSSSQAAKLTPAQLRSLYEASAKGSHLPDDCRTSSQIFAGAV